MHVNKLAGLVGDDGHIQQDLLCASSENKAELEISLEMTVSENLGQDQFLCFAHLCSSPKLMLLLCCVYCSLGAINSHGEYPFNSPTLITHVLPAQCKSQ